MWTKEIGKDPPMVGYEEVMNSEEGVYEWLKRIVRFPSRACDAPR